MRWYEVKRERAAIVKDNSHHAFRWISLSSTTLTTGGSTALTTGEESIRKTGCWSASSHGANSVRKSKTLSRGAGF